MVVSDTCRLSATTLQSWLGHWGIQGGGGGLCVCWEWVGAPMWVGTGVYMDAYVHVFVLMLNYSSILLYENFT